MTSYISFNFGLKRQIDIGYFDFSKTFDRINHDILLQKLHFFGFSNNYIQWFSTYLKNRTHVVKFMNCTSKVVNVYSGVPQGSHLGPLLFLMYVNDLPDVLNYCQCLLYADDVNLFLALEYSDDSLKMQDDINRLFHWSLDNCLSLNFKKCQIMSFYRHSSTEFYDYQLSDHSVQRCHSFNDLGILFDHQLRFNLHIDGIISKANSRLGLVKIWSKELNSLVRSILESSAPVWNSSYEIYSKRIESIQKQFLLFALRDLPWENRTNLPPYRHRLLLLDMNTLEDKRAMLSCTFVLNLIQKNINSQLIKFNCPSKILRNFSSIVLKFCCSNYLKNEPFTVCLRHFNNLFFLFDYNENTNNVKQKLKNYFKLNLN